MTSARRREVVDWIALSFATGVGSRTAADLIERFGSPSDCIDAPALSLEAAGLRRESVNDLKSGRLRERAESELDSLIDIGGRAALLCDADYPELLKATYDPPIVLYYRGDLKQALSQPAVAVVGSRRCSTYGRNIAQMLAREMAERGVTIVSGLARGIDSTAHRGALEGKGLTIAVMGTGLDMVYPREHQKLAGQIAEHGALVTEFALNSPPVSQNFPFRNRVISGLAFGVLVVEGAERSGSLITARLASEQNREVFAVPGNITSAKSFGPNYLIKDGAKLVQTWRDVVEELPSDQKAAILSAERGEPRLRQMTLDRAGLGDLEVQVLSMLKTDSPVHIDHLIASSRVSPAELMAALLQLEMGDRIQQLPGKCFVKRL